MDPSHVQVAGRDKVCNNNNKGSFVLRIPGNRYQKDDRSLEYDPEDEVKLSGTGGHNIIM